MSELETPFSRPRFPILTALLLFGNLAGFVLELKQGAGLSDFLNHYAFVPRQTMAYLGGATGTSFSRGVLTVFLTAFLHAGFLHLVINMFYLWLVGDVMELFLGRVRFLMLWMAGVVVWGVVGLATIPEGVAGLPALGSGGAIAILLGAYLGTYRHLLRAAQRPSRKRLMMIGTPIAVAALGWFPLQLLTGMTPLTRSLDTEYGPPWSAIAASFAVGVVLVQFLLPTAPAGAEAVGTPVLTEDTGKAAEAGMVGGCCEETGGSTGMRVN